MVPPAHSQKKFLQNAIESIILMRGEFPETLCIEQGVVLSCRFAEWTVRWTSRVLWMAVGSQSSENSSRQENRELPCRKQHTPLLSPKSHQPLLHSIIFIVTTGSTSTQYYNYTEALLGSFNMFFYFYNTNIKYKNPTNP